GLAERRRLLIAGVAGDWNRGAEEGGVARAVDLTAGPRLGEHSQRHSQRRQNLVVPGEGVDIEEQRARGVRVVGDVDASAAETPDQPGIDGAKEYLAALGTLAQSGYVL